MFFFKPLDSKKDPDPEHPWIWIWYRIRNTASNPPFLVASLTVFFLIFTGLIRTTSGEYRYQSRTDCDASGGITGNILLYLQLSVVDIFNSKTEDPLDGSTNPYTGTWLIKWNNWLPQFKKIYNPPFSFLFVKEEIEPSDANIRVEGASPAPQSGMPSSGMSYSNFGTDPPFFDCCLYPNLLFYVNNLLILILKCIDT